MVGQLHNVINMIDRIVICVILHSKGVNPNKNYDAIRKMVYKLYEEGHLMDLYPLMQHDDPSVRLIAALCLRNVVPEESEHTMMELCKMPTIVGMNARYTYKDWKAGNRTELI